MYLIGETNKKRGIAIFYTVIVAGIVLVVAYSISQIAFREVSFASLGKRSQQAFYAASSGLECALYWDLKQASFVGVLEEFSEYEIGNVTCAKTTIGELIKTPSASGGTVDFVIENLGTTGDSCANIFVTKEWDGEPLASNIITIIESRGIDDCTISSRRVERAIEVRY